MESTQPDSPQALGDRRYMHVWAWRIAVGFFILAGLTGVLFRIAITGLPTWGLSLENIRHAHSHTMFFGWVTPLLMAFIAYRIRTELGRSIPAAPYAIGAAFVTALIAFPAFLAFGYAPTPIGGARIPVSVIAAALNVIAWYWFAGAYWNSRREAVTALPTRLFDVALLFLVGATLGAWGLPLIQVLSPESHLLKSALTRIFLEWTSEGWFVLGVLGLASAGIPEYSELGKWGIRLVVLGLPFTFALGMPWSVVPPLFKILSSTGGLLLAAGLLVLVKTVWRHRPGRLWRFALAMLALKSVTLGFASLVPGESLIGVHSYRILYLHITLLGFVSVGLVAAARDLLGSALRGTSVFAVAVIFLLLTLVPLTPLWPIELAGRWTLFLSAAAGLALVLSAIPMLASRADKPDSFIA